MKIMQMCPECRGRGMVKVRDWKDGTDDLEDRDVCCTRCDGLGYYQWGFIDSDE